MVSSKNNTQKCSAAGTLFWIQMLRETMILKSKTVKADTTPQIFRFFKPMDEIKAGWSLTDIADR